jgi:hypothetical protein
MDSHCYVRNGIVYIPTQGMMDKGFYLDVEPVAVVPLANAKALHRAFAETIARGNPKVPIPRHPNIPTPVVLKYAGVKNWRSFARGTTTWALGQNNGVFSIHGYRKDEHGAGWVPDQATKETFPPGTSADQVIERMIAILQAAAGSGSSH